MELSRLEQLERLAKLRADNLLTADEFAAEKAKIIGGDGYSSAVSDEIGAQQAPRFWSRRWFIVSASTMAVATAGGAGFLIYNDFPTQHPAKVAATETVIGKAIPKPAPTPTPTTTTSCSGNSCRVLTPRGWAGIEAGMKVTRAESASGLSIRNDSHYDGVDGDCRRYEVVGGPSSLSMLVEGGRVTSLTAWEGSFKTDRGVKIGDRESQIRKLYKPLREEPDIYGEEGDKMIFFDTERGKFGIKFAVNSGKVSSITVGGSSRGYVEGCL